MRILFTLVLIFGILSSANAARLTDEEFHTEFEQTYSEAQYCLADIKFGETVEIPDPHVHGELVKAVDIRCANVMIGLYKMTKTPNQIEDYVGKDTVRINKFKTMQLGLSEIVNLIKTAGWKSFPNFQKAWEGITAPKPTGIPKHI